MAIGIVIVVAGLWLAVAPLTAARFANLLRFVPYGKGDQDVRYYRAFGVLLVIVGIAVTALLL